MNYEEELSKLQDEYDAKKEVIFKQIVSDDTVNKVEKLQLIAQYDLLEIDCYIHHPFEKYNEFIKIIQSNNEFIKKYSKYGPTTYTPIIDDCCHANCDRNETLYLSQLIENEYDEYMEDEDEDDGKITILTNRSTDDVYRITKEEYVDCIYEYAINNEIIGYKIDW